MRIVTDDAGDIPADLAVRHNIFMVPVNIMFGAEQYLSGSQMTHAQFYERVKTISDADFPKTSQPSPFQFVEAYRSMMATGENEFLTITVSEKLSGTYASAVAAARELEGEATIHLFDSQSASAGQGYMALEAARLLARGADLASIMARLERIRDETRIIFMINTLEFAVKGGRVGALQGTLASLLNIKPIMELRDGAVVEAGRVRTPRKALNHILEAMKAYMGDRPVKVAALHANAAEAGQQLLDQAGDTLQCTDKMLVDLTIPVVVNLGPGALGLVAIPDD